MLEGAPTSRLFEHGVVRVLEHFSKSYISTTTRFHKNALRVCIAYYELSSSRVHTYQILRYLRNYIMQFYQRFTPRIFFITLYLVRRSAPWSTPRFVLAQRILYLRSLQTVFLILTVFLLYSIKQNSKQRTVLCSTLC